MPRDVEIAMGLRQILLVASVLAFTQGCANHCDTYPDTLNDKLEECGIEVPEPVGGEAPEPSCTDARNAQAECLGDCIPEGCGAIDGSDDKARTSYAECQAKCPQAGL